MLTFSDIVAARDRLAPFVPVTPLRTYPSLDQAVGAGISVFVKHENHRRCRAGRRRDRHGVRA